METTEVLWLDDRTELTLDELAAVSGLPEDLLHELVASGTIAARRIELKHFVFSGDVVAIARSAARLRRDFELDVQGLTVALRLLDRVRELEDEVRLLRASIPGVL